MARLAFGAKLGNLQSDGIWFVWLARATAPTSPFPKRVAKAAPPKPRAILPKNWRRVSLRMYSLLRFAPTSGSALAGRWQGSKSFIWLAPHPDSGAGLRPTSTLPIHLMELSHPPGCLLRQERSARHRDHSSCACQKHSANRATPVAPDHATASTRYARP